jgi:capsule polysaccharide export protein KpsE/RkpR
MVEGSSACSILCFPATFSSTQIMLSVVLPPRMFTWSWLAVMNESPTRSTELTFWDHMSILLKHRRFFMIYFMIMIIASVSYALLSQEWYTSRARLLPPPSDSFGLSSLLPSIAQGALGAVGGLSNESTLVLSILDSRELRDNVIDNFSWMEIHPVKNNIEAYDRFDSVVSWEVNENGLIIIAAEEETPQLAAETVNYIVEFVRDKFTIISRAQAQNQRKFFERRLNQNYQDLAAAEEALNEFQKRTGIFALEEQIQASLAALSSVYAQLTIAEVAYEVASTTLPASSPQVLAAKTEMNALRGKYDMLRQQQDSEASSLFIELDSAPDYGLEFVRRMRDVELQGMILEFLLPQFEQARILEMKEESNIYILDRGEVPDKRSRPRRSFVVLAWLFASFLVLYPILLFTEWMERLQVEDPERYSFIHGTMTLLKPKYFWSNDKPSRKGSSS